jgi:cytochrome c biogenesis protein CcdA
MKTDRSSLKEDVHMLAIYLIGLPWIIFAAVAFLFIWKGTNPLVRRIGIASLAAGVLIMLSGVAMLALT